MLARMGDVFIEMVAIIILLIVVIISVLLRIYKTTKQKVSHCVSTEEELHLLYAFGEVCNDVQFLELINGDGKSFTIWGARFVDAIELEIFARRRVRELTALCLEKGIARWKINAFTC